MSQGLVNLIFSFTLLAIIFCFAFLGLVPRVVRGERMMLARVLSDAAGGTRDAVLRSLDRGSGAL